MIMSINKQENMSINSQRLSSTTTSMQNNTSARTSSTNQSDAMHVLSKSAVLLTFKPPDYYEAEEQAAMTVQVTINDHEELFMSIGGIKRSVKVDKSNDADGKINEEVVDNDDDEVDEEDNTVEVDDKAPRNSGVEAIKSVDSRDIMEQMCSRWSMMMMMVMMTTIVSMKMTSPRVPRKMAKRPQL
jgi:hypothetical protein